MKLTRLFTSKKAADPNQIFIYISAIVIVGFVFLYGFKAVATFVNSSQDIELAKFVKDFKTSATSVSANFGSIKYVTIRIPSQFTQMCIIDTSDGFPAFDAISNCPSELGQEICDAWYDYSLDSSLERKNIFFTDQLKHVGYKDTIEDIVLDYNSESVNPGGFLCTKDGKLKLEGTARVTMVSASN